MLGMQTVAMLLGEWHTAPSVKAFGSRSSEDAQLELWNMNKSPTVEFMTLKLQSSSTRPKPSLIASLSHYFLSLIASRQRNRKDSH